MQQELNIDVFGERIQMGGRASAAEKIPRTHLEKFNLREARLGDKRFIAAVAKEYPRVIGSIALVRAVSEVDPTPVAICLEAIDPGLRNAYRSEGIAFASEDGNAYLPFLSIQQTPTRVRRPPSPLSPQAQRIALNLVAGRWEGRTASELAVLCNKSRSSVTKYLKELEAIRPALVQSSWKSRTLVNPWPTKEELLDAIEPYLRSPVSKRVRLACAIPVSLLAHHGARVTGISALPFFSDLSSDASRLDVMMDAGEVAKLEQDVGADWRMASWSEEAPLVIEIWTYPLDAASRASLAQTGLECVDPYSLYAELISDQRDDVRVTDSIEQLRRQLCL